jgi:hypothetical protein
VNRIVLLPTAKLVPIELQAEFGQIPSGMVPLDSKPALFHIAKWYADQGCDVVAATHERAELVSSYVARNQSLVLDTIDVGATSTLGETVLRALESMNRDDTSQLIVNFADTLIREDIQQGDFVFYKVQPDTFRWTTFTLDDANDFKEILEKGVQKSSLDHTSVFVGLFAFSDVNRLFTELSRAVEANKTDVDPFYAALAAYWSSLPSDERQFIAVDEWYDLGHLDTYYSTNRSLFLNKRAFNQVVVDDSRGVIRKSSSDPQKLLAEINWYLRMPRRLSHLAPRVFDFTLDPENPWMEMEFYGYPTLSDAYLVADWDEGTWARALRALGLLLEQMHAHRFRPPDTSVLVEAMKEMYENKTIYRARQLLDDPEFERFREPELEINGVPCLGLERALELLPDLLNDSGIYDLDEFTVIHGDLCFSNILFDRRSGVPRLIDPRGSFGNFDIYGDPRYDLAKLSHSMRGDYDFLLNDLFDLQWDKGSLKITPHLKSGHDRIKALFTDWLETQRPDITAHARLIESLLFISMVPLHADRPRSQIAFLGQGLQLLSEASGARLPTARGVGS